ncbi:MAG: BLUF domain-containing protein [Bdellovibrionota bacterium]|nr:BLUF domain-containing protein [Bdellovibrionota bacterium]
MHYKFYVSKSTKFYSEEEVLDMLSDFQKNNDDSGITGILLYKSGHFLQLLESDDKEKLETLYYKISQDKRHSHVKTIVEGEYEKRIFEHWSMAFKNIESIDHDLSERIDEFIKSYEDEDTFDKEIILNTLKKFFYTM